MEKVLKLQDVVCWHRTSQPSCQPDIFWPCLFSLSAWYLAWEEMRDWDKLICAYHGPITMTSEFFREDKEPVRMVCPEINESGGISECSGRILLPAFKPNGRLLPSVDHDYPSPSSSLLLHHLHSSPWFMDDLQEHYRQRNSKDSNLLHFRESLWFCIVAWWRLRFPQLSYQVLTWGGPDDVLQIVRCPAPCFRAVRLPQ